MARTDSALLARAVRGETDAVRALVVKVSRCVHNILYRASGSREVARDLLPQALRRVVADLDRRPWGDGPLAAWLIEVARDTCYEVLPSSAYQTTLFAQARDVLSEPISLPPLQPDFLDAEEAPLLGLDTGFKEAMGQGQLLVLELLFIERVPLEALAEFLGVSMEVASSFVYTVFDVLGDTSNLTHDPACLHDLRLALEVIQCAVRPTALRALEEKHGRCRSCQLVLRRCLRIVRLFEIDSRLSCKLDSTVLDAVLAPAPSRHEAALAPRTGAALDQARAAGALAGGPSGPPRLPGMAGGMPGAALGLGAANPWPRPSSTPQAPSRWPFILLVAGLVGLVVGVVPRYLHQTSDASVLLVHESPVSTPVVGTFDNPYLQGQPIHVGQVIASAKNHHTTLSLDSGVRMQLGPSAVVKVLEREVVVVSGKVGVATAHGLTAALRIGERAVTFASGEGVVESAAGQASVAVLRGESTVAGADGSVRLDSGRKAMLTADRVMVGDLTDAERTVAEAGSGSSLDLVPSSATRPADLAGGALTPPASSSSSSAGAGPGTGSTGPDSSGGPHWASPPPPTSSGGGARGGAAVAPRPVSYREVY